MHKVIIDINGGAKIKKKCGLNFSNLPLYILVGCIGLHNCRICYSN